MKQQHIYPYTTMLLKDTVDE